MAVNISIIVPVYKVEEQLDECIKSILNQKFIDFELILVDDGSPDRCGQICDEYSKKDKRIKVIHKSNGGLSDARNAGLDIAKGKYIGFVDSDDIIDSNMYKILFECINKSNSDIVQCKFKKFKKLDEISIGLDYSGLKIKEFNSKQAIIDMIDNNEINVNSWNKLYKKDIFNDIRFPKGKIHEDEFLTYKLLFKSNKISYVDKELYYYYKNDKGIMNGSSLLKRLDRIEALEERSEFFLNNREIDLYNKSNAALFFALNKLYFIFVRNKELKRDKENIEIIKNKIGIVARALDKNNYLSPINISIVKMINKNKKFIGIYYMKNYLLSIKYRLKDKFTKERIV